MSKGILLESGTNELEIVEFEVANNKFGINVIKVKEIIQPMNVTFIPHVHEHVEGIIQLRGEVLPVVDMLKVLGIPNAQRNPQQKYIVAEFNKDEMILLLDFERIMVDINPASSISVEDVKKLGKRERSEKKIVIAEDSPLLRKLLFDTMQEAGYMNLDFFENGRDVYEYLEALVKADKNIENHVQLVITDVEMPQMDGHHLTKKIKTHPDLRKLPVIIFSSLITDDLRHKGEEVGAEDQISKPEIAELILRMDQLIL